MPKPTLDEIATLSHEVAGHLPNEWTASEDDAYMILGPQGMSLYLNHHQNRVFGDLPEKHLQYLTDEQLKTRSIGVILSRPPRDIALEITRRLLPDYEPLYRDLAKRKAGAERFNRRRLGLAERLESLLPSEARVEPWDDKKAQVVLHLNETQAARVAEALEEEISAGPLRAGAHLPNGATVLVTTQVRSHLDVILCELPPEEHQRYVVWWWNRQTQSAGQGEYFDRDEFPEAANFWRSRVDHYRS